MAEVLDYDKLLAQLTDHANKPTTKAKRLGEAIVAMLAYTDQHAFEVSHQALASAAERIREDGWQPMARATDNGVEWYLADTDGEPVKPTDTSPDWPDTSDPNN
jgi:hypothetical protein